jgi:hypothetical protein
MRRLLCPLFISQRPSTALEGGVVGAEGLAATTGWGWGWEGTGVGSVRGPSISIPPYSSTVLEKLLGQLTWRVRVTAQAAQNIQYQTGAAHCCNVPYAGIDSKVPKTTPKYSRS